MPQYRQKFARNSRSTHHTRAVVSLCCMYATMMFFLDQVACGRFFSPVREGCDDQPAVVSEVFVPVQLDCVDHLARDRARFSRNGRLAPLLPVVPVFEAF